MTTSLHRFRQAQLRAGAAPLGLALALLAMPAFAQDQPTTAPAQAAPAEPAPDATPADVVVTGTLFRNASTTTASPLTVITSADLARRGINTAADAINSIPANNAGSMNKSWNSFNFATGATAVSLRGLTTGNTLTLFDGLRSAPYPLADDGHRNFVDLNTIPGGIIDRIEVLQDGASATYGADAVAGVVNVIIKKQITGLHLEGSAGISEFGDAGERRLAGTFGYGKLSEQGFNVYVNAEYQKNDPLFAHDRKYPYNTGDLSGICNAPGNCLNNAVTNGIQGDGTIAGIGSTRVPVVRPFDSTTGKATGDWRLLNPAAGCRDLRAITLTPAQQAALAKSTGFGAQAQQCQQDNIADYLEEQPTVERFGATARATVNVGSNAQAYAMFNYYRTKTDSSIAPLSFAGQTAAGGTTFAINPVILPVYVCAARVNCATNASRTLNPNNPFAALGQEAQVNYRYDKPRITLSDTRTYRASAGINGTFGNDWRYAVEGTWSEVDLKITNKNFLFAQHLLDVINDGTFNFVDPSANTQAMRDYIAPTQVTDSVSRLWQTQATLTKDVFTLPGGPLSAAVGVAYRKESITNPSANPANEVNPANRYYSINSVGATGSRNVKSAFFELQAPVFDMLTLNASGRYDDYSSGQKNFSPKFTAIFKPIPQLKLRGTFSKGFRIPSFNEAYGLPTTGYITAQVDSTPGTPGAAFIAAHGGNAYATQPYSYGLTAIGNPALKPEKSTSFTGGIVLEPTPNLSFTADYWHIKIKGLITNPDYSGVEDAYYANNGVVNIPGLTVLPGLKDPDHPNALPLLGFIQYSFVNANSETASGLDFSGTARFPIGGSVTFTSRVDASYLIRLEKDIDGIVQRYDGTLSPCDITSCSGAPKWRGTWTNTLDFGKTSFTGTVNYTGGYDMASVDYGGVAGDCAANAGVSVVTYKDGTPFKCRAKRFITVDLTGSTRIADHLTVYFNVLNILGAKPDFNPGQSYNLGYNYNVAWEGQGFTGRFFRVGAKVDF
jgi:iron complex outermembrane receptor protein